METPTSGYLRDGTFMTAVHTTPRVSSPPRAIRRHPSAWSLWPTLAVTWIALAHVLSFQGLAICNMRALLQAQLAIGVNQMKNAGVTE